MTICLNISANLKDPFPILDFSTLLKEVRSIDSLVYHVGMLESSAPAAKRIHPAVSNPRLEIFFNSRDGQIIIYL